MNIRYTLPVSPELAKATDDFFVRAQRIRQITNNTSDREVSVNAYNHDVTRTAEVVLGRVAGSTVSVWLHEDIDSGLKRVGNEVVRRGRVSSLLERFSPRDLRYTEGGLTTGISGSVTTDSDTDAHRRIGRFRLGIPEEQALRDGRTTREDYLTDTIVWPRGTGRGNYLERADSAKFIDGVLSLAEAAVGIHRPDATVPDITFALGQEFLRA